MRITTFAQSAAAQDTNDELARAKREEIASRPGGIKGFAKNVILDPVVTESDHAAMADGFAARAAAAQADGFKGKKSTLLNRLKKETLQTIARKVDDFYAVYEKCFPIPGERESREGFNEILTEGNFDKALKAKVGEYREFLYILRDPATKEVIGGLNFVAYLHNGDQPTMHSTYAFLAPAYRGLGLANEMFDMRDKIGINFFAQTPQGRAALKKFGGVYTCSEQNIPELMDGLSYVKDSSQAIDQVRRLEIWTKLGYSALNFPYVQPPLVDGGDPCDVLSLNTYRRPVTLNARGGFDLGPIERPDTIPAQSLYNHLRAFFTQSVCKDPNTPETDATTMNTLASLSKLIKAGQPVYTVPLDERKKYLQEWKSQIGELKDIYGRARLNGTETIQGMWDRLQRMTTDLTARREAKITPAMRAAPVAYNA
jgi:hypothetical protein